MNLNLSGKRVLVTGGSKGIGMGIAKALAAEGAELILVSRDIDEGEASKKVGRPITAVNLDLSQQGAAEQLGGRFPDIDILVNNAGAVPWPDLVRMMRLGVMTCQRGSDLIRMGPEHRDRNGLWCRPLKTRKRRRSFHIPLAAADALEIDRWAETPVTFTNSRWRKPIDRFREDLYLYSPKGAQYTADGLRARWGRWLADTPEGREICRRWKEWVAAQVKKYDWDIEPDDADHPTIHGLRGTGILARAEQGYEVDQIANDIGMSRQNVEHYMRFKDQMQVAAQGQKRLRLVAKED